MPKCIKHNSKPRYMTEITLSFDEVSVTFLDSLELRIGYNILH